MPVLQYGNVGGANTFDTAGNSLLVLLLTLLFYTPPVLAILVVGPQTIEAHAMVSYISRHPSDDATAQVTEYHESRRGTSSTSLPSVFPRAATVCWPASATSPPQLQDVYDLL